jgi:hypothetical protein
MAVDCDLAGSLDQRVPLGFELAQQILSVHRSWRRRTTLLDEAAGWGLPARRYRL